MEAELAWEAYWAWVHQVEVRQEENITIAVVDPTFVEVTIPIEEEDTIMEEAMEDQTGDKIQIILGIRTIDHNVKFVVSLDTQQLIVGIGSIIIFKVLLKQITISINVSLNLIKHSCQHPIFRKIN